MPNARPLSIANMRLISAAFVLLNVAAVSHALRAQPQDNPNRPPWAQKSRTNNTSPPAIVKPDGSDATTQPTQDRGGKIKVKVDLVSVLVSVLDEHNRPAADLPADAFQVFDEDNPQKIAVFEKETQQPLDLALMVDTSLSTQLSMPAQREAASHFIQQVLRSGDHLGIYSVDENVTQLAAFSENVGHLQDVVRHIPTGAGTSLYDAVLLGSRSLSKQGSDRRRVIILITDGGETTSHADFESARREAVRNSTLLYTVLIRTMKSENGRNTAGEHALETITDTTGGAVFYPQSTGDLDAIFDRINRELRTQYRLGYYPNPRGPADTYRRIEVKVTPPSAAASAPPTEGQQPESQPATPPAQHVYSVRHRKSYYTGPQ